MKPASVRNSIMVLISFLPGVILASAPPVEHVALTRSIEKAMEWSLHVRAEVAKGKKLDKAHAAPELKGLRDALEEMSQSYLALSKQPAAEVTEGHFVAIKTHQAKAQSELELIEAEMAKQAPDSSVMRKAAKIIEAELKAAAKEHHAELSELDVK